MPDLPAWFADAEYQAAVSVLQWDTTSTTAPRVATWHHRHLFVWRGRIVLTRTSIAADGTLRPSLDPVLTKWVADGAGGLGELA